MLAIKKSDVMLIDGNLVTEASMIGLKPGDWPDFIMVTDNGSPTGNDKTSSGFLFGSPRKVFAGGTFGGARDDGELAVVIYTTRNGNELHVLND